MRNLTLIMSYYENAGMLAEQLRWLQGMHVDIRSRLTYIVVDDGSPTAPAASVWPTQDPPIALYKVFRMEQDIRWNTDACRNIGAHYATTKWLLLTDMDHRPPEELLRECMERPLDERVAYKFRRCSMPDLSDYKPHPNSWLMTRGLYDAADGYDERFAGYYGTDGDFRDRVQEVAASIETINQRLIRYPREVIPDASTTQYERKAPYDGKAIADIKADRNRVKGWRTRRLSFKHHLAREAYSILL